MKIILFHARFALSSLLIGLCICAPAYAQGNSTKSFLNIQEITSASGIKAWLVEDHAVPVIAMEYVFRDTGSKTDPAEKQGLARLASNTMDEGAGDIKSQDFQKEIQDLSVTLQFNVTRDNFGGSLKTLTKNKDRAFELLKLALKSPRFDQEPLDRMRAANLSRIKSSVVDPEWMAARIQNDRIFENHPYALNSGGTLSSLGKITAEDLHAFHKKLGKNRLVIAVAGDITADELKAKLDEIFGTLPDVENKTEDKTTLTNVGKTYLYKQDIPQTIIEITQNGISRSDENYHAAQMLNFVLGSSGFGSRLTEEIREKRGLTYGIYSYFREYEAAEVLHVSTSTANENAKPLIDLVKTEWKKITEEPVSDKELQDAKAYLIGSLPLSLTSTNSIAELLLSLQLDHLPIDYLDKRRERLYAITAQDIQKTAQRLLDSSTFTTILVGNPQGFENVEIMTALPNVE